MSEQNRPAFVRDIHLRGKLRRVQGDRFEVWQAQQGQDDQALARAIDELYASIRKVNSELASVGLVCRLIDPPEPPARRRLDDSSSSSQTLDTTQET